MHILPGLPPIEVTLRRSARARRFSLRVSQLDGRVTLSLPQRAREAEAMEFLRGHEDWLRVALSRTQPRRLVTIGDTIPVEGRLMTLSPGTGRSLRVEGGDLRVPGDAALAGRRTMAFLQTLARERLAAASDHFAAQIGRRVTRITLRDPRSRWGSCTQDGALMYSWRLVMAPPPVLDYVVAHEVAHMVQMNHSDAFWAVVDGLYPGWQDQRRWLRTEGNQLHGFHFIA
jgi:predicted metal-dependent hydrolase